ncbi:26.5 kDa heat shock protein, mitochondrial [Olea europaea var. sylvestris]|uniref:26.5 kDa heat shock protein, mitochondrial n=1 Tax=Olea europaea var. sylvestris TaxID=158386 RepID=UPI000C1CF826|nr:26.5 kDa heat shock protein, mitochondrial [Olea europaea var. sylvestris]
MALARLAMKSLQQRVVSPSSSLLSRNVNLSTAPTHKEKWASEFLRRLSTVAGEKSEGGAAREVAVSEGGDKTFKLFPRKKNRRGLWRSHDRDVVPASWELFPSGLGNALLQATENINRLFEKLSPSNLIGKVKEKKECYKLRYEVPGLGKDDVKITVEDGVLTIKGEHKEEEEEGSDDEYWSSKSYGYYNTSLLLPDDAKIDEITAEIKDGVLTITVPRIERDEKIVKEIKVN